MFLLKEINYLKQFYLNATFYIIPLINVDGASLVLNGLKTKNKTTQFLKGFDNKTNFSLYKSNANGVDINTNFNALWGQGKSNVKVAGFSDFIGFEPNSEPETRALIDFTDKIKPELTISYHAKGEVIYYDFVGLEKEFSKKQKSIAKIISNHLNYRYKKAKNSTGGYKDYCLSKFKITSFTIEVGNDKFSHPFPCGELGIIFNQNKNLPLILQRII